MLEEMRKEDQRVKYLWEVLEKFSNEDRSRFLRFVTGRRRLPAVMHVVGELVFSTCIPVYLLICIFFFTYKTTILCLLNTCSIAIFLCTLE